MAEAGEDRAPEGGAPGEDAAKKGPPRRPARGSPGERGAKEREAKEKGPARAEDSGEEASPQAEPGGDEDETRDQPLGLHERRGVRSAFERMSGGVGFAGPAEFGGDAAVAGRDQYNFYGGRIDRAEVVTGTVSDELLDWIAAIYVEPSVYGEALDILRRRHVAVLHGRQHWGKQATALRLLQGVQAGQIRSLSADEDVRRLASEDFDGIERGGYLIDTIAPAQARLLSDFQLGVLSDALRDHGGHLVITVDSRAVRRHELADGWIVDCEQPPDPVEVLRRDLLARLAEDQAVSLLALPRLQNLLQQPFLHPPQVARFAEALADAVAASRDPDLILDQFDGRAYDEVREWFQRHTERIERAFMVALAVFDEAPYQDVLDAAAELETLFRQFEDPEDPGGHELLSLNKREQLEIACARAVWAEETRSIGTIWVEAVEFTDEQYGPAVLDTVWGHPDMRRLLLTWLKRLAEQPSVRIRVRAAMALGRLSVQEFGYVHDEILWAWSGAQSYRQRQCVAWTLAVPTLDAALAPVVRALLREWSDSDSTYWRRLTAATAYGSEVGLGFPNESLQGLKRIAAGDDDDTGGICEVVSYSVMSLFEAQRGDVLTTLLRWTDTDTRSSNSSADRALVRDGLACFLRIADEGVLEEPPAQQGWPHLLAITHADPHALRCVIKLWRRSLDKRVVRELALQVLRGWVRRADHDQLLRTALRPMIQALASTPEEKQRLIHHLERWAKDRHQPSRAAADFLNLLIRQKGLPNG